MTTRNHLSLSVTLEATPQPCLLHLVSHYFYFSLQALHLHNNHLSAMPDEILMLKRLVILVLAFNKFHQVPASVAQLTDVRTSECETVIMAGNLIETLSTDVILRLKHVKKVWNPSFRNFNYLPPSSFSND